MENYVVSCELAEKLRDAGYSQNTQNVWERFDGIPKGRWYLTQPELMRRYGLWSTQEVKERCAAPISDELLEQLPEYIYEDGIDHWLHITAADTHSSWMAQYGKTTHSTIRNKPADALAELWLWCKENVYI